MLETDTAAVLPRVLHPPRVRGRRMALPRGSDALLFFAGLALAIGLLTFLRSAFNVDSWLELVAGRQIWFAGIPHHETLTAMAHGARWIDQQWLSQLAAYALDRIGGLGLLGLVNVVLIVISVGAAAVASRYHGASARTVMLVLPLVLWTVIPSGEVRTEWFAMPLFVAVLYLLSADSRRPSRAVYWCLPLLVLWANVHGTVTFGAGLVTLRGATLAWDRRSALARSPASWLRPLALIVLPPLCLLVTPYGLDVASYYKATLGNAALKHAVTEWQPITADIVLALPFFILAGLALWSFGRNPRQTTSWEKLALITLAAVTVDAVRGTLLFGLCALMILPVSLEATLVGRAHGDRHVPVRDRLNAALGLTLVATLLIAATTVLSRPVSYFAGSQNLRVLRVVQTARATNPNVRLLADGNSADWLLWEDPQLRGQVAFDARFELLSTAQLSGIERMLGVAGDWKRIARGYRLLVLDRQASSGAADGFLTEPGRHVLYEDRHTVVLLRAGVLR